MLKVLGGVFLLYRFGSLISNKILSKFPYQFKSVGFESITLYKTTFSASINITNLTPKTVTISGFTGKLSFSGQALVDIQRTAEIVLEAGASKLIRFDVILTNTFFLNQLSKILAQSINPIFRLDGNLLLGSKKLPISTEFGLR